MDHMSSSLYLGATIVFALLFSIALVSVLKIVKTMFKVPNERIIQVNIDYRFIPLALSSVLVFVLGSTSWYGAQKTKERKFLENPEANENGYMGVTILKDYLTAFNGEDCGHVSRKKDIPVFIAIEPESEHKALCGITNSMLDKHTMVPYVRIDNTYNVRIGDWPFEYSISFTKTNQDS